MKTLRQEKRKCRKVTASHNEVRYHKRNVRVLQNILYIYRRPKFAGCDIKWSYYEPNNQTQNIA